MQWLHSRVKFLNDLLNMQDIALSEEHHEKQQLE
jgi:hypothetical protein